MNRILLIAFLVAFSFSCGEVTKRGDIKSETDSTITQNKEKYVPQIFDSIKLTKFGIDSLRLIRNEVFARRGLIFKSNDLQEYFRIFDWYLPKYNDVTDQLNDVDKMNIKLVQNIENFKNERHTYIRNLPNMHDENNMYNFLEVEFKDYPYWNKPIPKKNDPHTIIFVNGKKKFENCIFVSYYTYSCGYDGNVPPAIEYTYYIDVYDLNGLLVHSNLFNGDPLANHLIKENKLYYYIKTYKSIYSEAEKDSGYYDELHMEVSGSKERVFHLNSFNMTVEEIN